MPRDFSPDIPAGAAFGKSAQSALTLDGVFSQALGILTGGPLLIGCALALGASPFFIGILAAIPFFAQIAHIPAIILIERIRRRKAICVAMTLAARALLLPLAIVPAIPDHNLALGVLLACFAIVTPLGAVGGCAWMSWTCDLVPRERLGTVFSRRQACANVAGIVAGLAGAALVDGWGRYWPSCRVGGYVGVFVLAIAAALASTWYLTRMPEVPMPPKPPGSLRALFAKPFADANFRRVMVFLGSWSLATNLAIPFFTVYLIQDLGCGVTIPVVLSAIGQFANLAMLPLWGRISDRRSNKAVISLCAPVVLLCLLGWILAAQPLPHSLALPFLVAVQLVLGGASSGLDLACGNIALKTAPRGDVTVYLGANGICKSICGGVAPIIAGLVAQHLSGLSGPLALGGAFFTLRPLHLLFLAAGAVGLFALAQLRRIEESGDANRGALLGAARRAVPRFLARPLGRRFLLR